MIHTGYLYKMGDGPINYKWNRRFMVLDPDNKVLSYFLRETDSKARGHINLRNATVSQVMPIMSRQYSFSIKEDPKGKKEVNLSAESEEDADLWVNLIDKCTPSNDIPSWDQKKETVERNTYHEEPKLDRLDTEQKFPDNTELFRKVKMKLMGRNTIHLKKKRLTEAQNDKIIAAVSKVSPAAFGSIPDDFRKQLSSVETYLTKDDLFKFYKFDHSSRITYYQKEAAFKVNKKEKLFWIALFALFLILTFIVGPYYS